MKTFPTGGIINPSQKLAIFFHVAQMGTTWMEVEGQVMAKLKTSGLLDRADFFIKNDCKDVSRFEFPTMEMLHHFCRRYPDFYVLYLHTKGVSKPHSRPVADWRECMLYFNVERWRDCIKKLSDGFDAVSVGYMPTPMPHFQGNIWWAKAGHIKDLICIRDIADLSGKQGKGVKPWEDRHKCEVWLLSKKCRIHSFYHWNCNPYRDEHPRSKYDGKGGQIA